MGHKLDKRGAQDFSDRSSMRAAQRPIKIADGKPTNPPDLDEDTMRQCVIGNLPARRRFLERYQGPLFTYLSRLLGPGPHVEELAQETLVKAIERMHKYDFNVKPFTWILYLARAEYVRVDLFRKSQRTELLGSKLRVLCDNKLDPEESASNAELRNDIIRALGSLPPKQREAFLLWVDDIPFGDIAHVLRCPVATAKSRVRLAKGHLRAELGIHWPETGDV